MAAQRAFILSGDSRVSLVDVGLGALGGLGVPYGAAMALREYAPVDQPWVAEWADELGAVVGLGASVALGAWRGMAPATISAVLAGLFAIKSLADRYLGATPAAVMQSITTGQAQGLGLLTARAASPQFGSAGHLTVQRPNSLASAMAGADTSVFGAPSFGSVGWAG